MRKPIATLLWVGLSLLGAGTVLAVGLPWQNHSRPFDFLFGNHIDMHQQSRLVDNKALEGFLYIKFTGQVSEGIPEAVHADCTQMPNDCTAGWTLRGIPVTAKLVDMPHMDHPIWCIERDVLPPQQGYTYFHWLGDPQTEMDLQIGKEYLGYLIKLTALDTFYFLHHGEATLVTPGIDYNSHTNIVTDCN